MKYSYSMHSNGIHSFCWSSVASSAAFYWLVNSAIQTLSGGMG